MHGQSINEKLERYLAIPTRIQVINKRGIRESDELDEIHKQKATLEAEIKRMQMNDACKLDDPVLDYCFRNFDNPLDKSQDVYLFARQVKKLKDHKIFAVQGSKLEAGVISAECAFSVEETGYLRQLHVPVNPRFFLNEAGSWSKTTGRLFINSDLFEYSAFLLTCASLDGGIWETDYSKTQFMGPAPQEIKIYLGDKYVKEGLEKHKQIEVTKRVQVPSPF